MADRLRNTGEYVRVRIEASEPREHICMHILRRKRVLGIEMIAHLAGIFNFIARLSFRTPMCCCMLCIGWAHHEDVVMWRDVSSCGVLSSQQWSA